MVPQGLCLVRKLDACDGTAGGNPKHAVSTGALVVWGGHLHSVML
jgi:hypothetical protein